MADSSTEFTAPPFLSDQSADEIHQRMLANLPDDIDKAEGGFAWDFTRPTADEKAEMVEFELQETIKLMFPQYSYDAWLDMHAAMRGLTRKAATAATGTLTVTGTPGTIISSGFLFSTVATADTPSVQFQTTEITTIGTGGTATVPIESTQAGTIGNVSANTVTLMVKPLTGIQSMTNPATVSGGTEAENDESLKARIQTYDSSQGASFVGSIADYKRWALEVAGVGSVIVIPPTEDDGITTIVVTDSNGAPATTELTQAVYNHIMRPDDPESRLAPVNALLSVISPASISITIAATVQIQSGSTITAITAAFTAALKDYYPTAITQREVKYTAVGALLLATAGVNDYSGLTINGGTANIPITESQSPITESVVLTAS